MRKEERVSPCLKIGSFNSLVYKWGSGSALGCTIAFCLFFGARGLFSFILHGGPSFLRIVCLGDYCKSMAPSFPFSLLFSFLVAVKQHILLSHACIALLLMSISQHILLVVHFFTGLCSHSCVWLHVGWTFAHTYIPHTYPLIFLFILLLFPYTDWRAHLFM
jgi:hypothetical protein